LNEVVASIFGLFLKKKSDKINFPHLFAIEKFMSPFKVDQKSHSKTKILNFLQQKTVLKVDKA